MNLLRPLGLVLLAGLAAGGFAVYRLEQPCAEGLVALKRHLGKGMSGRVGSRGDCAECVPLGKRCPNFSQSAVHRPVVTELELFDGSTQVA